MYLYALCDSLRLLRDLARHPSAMLLDNLLNVHILAAQLFPTSLEKGFSVLRVGLVLLVLLL